MLTQFTKKCPKCGREQSYSCKSSLTLAVRKNRVCGVCSHNYRKIIIPEGGWTRVCKECGKEMKYSCKRAFVLCEKNNGLCRVCGTKKASLTKDFSIFKTIEYREKQSKMMKDKRKTNSFGESFKEKCRINKLKKIQEQGVAKTYNENACKFIDELNKKLGLNLQHALNGGEFNVSGFSLDGYDEKKNVVFEYDEPKHNKKCQIKKDKYRQQIIIEKLKPVKFLRFNEEYNVLKDIISGKEIG